MLIMDLMDSFTQLVNFNNMETIKKLQSLEMKARQEGNYIMEAIIQSQIIAVQQAINEIKLKLIRKGIYPEIIE